MTREPPHCPHCGAVLGKTRSLADHNRFFAILDKAYQQWPHTYADFQPQSAEHLRKWLLVAVEHCYVVDTIDLAWAYDNKNPALLEMAKLTAIKIADAVVQKNDYVFRRLNEGSYTLDILRAKSMDHKSLSQEDFAPIRDAICDLIEQVIGVTCDKLLNEHAA